MKSEIYSEVQQRFNTLQLFEKIDLAIMVRQCTPGELERSNWSPFSSTLGNRDDGEKRNDYQILELRLTNVDRPDSAIAIKVNDVVQGINHELKQDLKQNQLNLWNIFYVYKELFQSLVDESGNPTKATEDGTHFNYFRGQVLDYPMVPGVFRQGVKPEFVTNFDKIYRQLSNEYPKQLQYVPYSVGERRERVQQLSLLQHYGLKTSLVDITKNPFIALEFMSDLVNSADWMAKIQNGKLHCGSFDLFAIDEESHSDHNIFVDVAKTDLNRRLIAQSGAFFCYDYLKDLEFTKVKRIPRLSIHWEYDFEDAQEAVKRELKQIQDDREQQLESNNGVVQGKLSIWRSMIEYSTQVQEEQLDAYQHNIRQHAPDIFLQMFEDIQEKLSQYFYFRKNLFPDLDKYIEFITSKYAVQGQLKLRQSNE